MTRRPPGFLVAAIAALLGACAPGGLATVVPDRPDCSFRSATTCWTLVGRFPGPRRDARDSAPSDPRAPARLPLAVAPDSGGAANARLGDSPSAQ